MSRTPLISVILPLYNCREYIHEAIESILNQTYTNFELIIIDDGSEDGSKEIVDQFNDQRIRLYSHETNKGLILTLNEGIKLSKGDFIARMDADDISLPERFKKQIEFLLNNEDIGICSTWFKILADVPYYKKEETNPDKVKCKLLFCCPIAHPAVMMRKQILDTEQVNYSIDYPHAEDYELWTRLSKTTRITNLPEVLFHYRKSPFQISQKHKKSQEFSLMKAQNKLLSKLNIYPDENESKLNYQIFFQQFPNDLQFALDAEKWLLKIIQSNKPVGFFSPSALNETVFQSWFLICTHLASNKINTFNVFFNSPLFHFKYMRKIDLLKFTIKNVLIFLK